MKTTKTLINSPTNLFKKQTFELSFNKAKTRRICAFRIKRTNKNGGIKHKQPFSVT
jgi:hypothetical protein